MYYQLFRISEVFTVHSISSRVTFDLKGGTVVSSQFHHLYHGLVVILALFNLTEGFCGCQPAGNGGSTLGA